MDQRAAERYPRRGSLASTDVEEDTGINLVKVFMHCAIIRKGGGSNEGALMA